MKQSIESNAVVVLPLLTSHQASCNVAITCNLCDGVVHVNLLLYSYLLPIFILRIKTKSQPLTVNVFVQSKFRPPVERQINGVTNMQ